MQPEIIPASGRGRSHAQTHVHPLRGASWLGSRKSSLICTRLICMTCAISKLIRMTKHPFEQSKKPPKLPRSKAPLPKDDSSRRHRGRRHVLRVGRTTASSTTKTIHHHQKAATMQHLQHPLLLLQGRCLDISTVGCYDPTLGMPWTWHWQCLMLRMRYITIML
jgi:hypothetical protein